VAVRRRWYRHSAPSMDWDMSHDSAAKAYVLSLGEALNHELRPAAATGGQPSDGRAHQQHPAQNGSKSPLTTTAL
jgi:hypothetical protein